MKKSLLLIAAAGLIASSCSNEADMATNSGTTGVDSNAVVITTDNAATREAMNYDLVHTWNSSDVMGIFSTYDKDGNGTYVDNGASNAKFTFMDTYTNSAQTFHNVFIQTTTPKVKWQSGTLKHNFWMYSPRVEATSTNPVTVGSVPFTLASTQTQTTANVWSNPTVTNTTTDEYKGYNFIWHNITNAYRPYDRSIPFYCHRLLPVAEFNIVRDDATLDGYNLTGITMTPTDATKPMPSGAVTNGINLEGLASCTSLTFGESAASFTLDNKGDGSGIAVSSVDLNKSFSTYMSVAPAASKEYKIVATFGNGTKTKVVTITRSDEFTIAAGKGNIVRYYFKTSKAKDPGDAINGGYGAYVVGVQTSSVSSCPSYNEITWYLKAGAYWDDGTGANPQSYTVTNPATGKSTVYHTGLWLKKKQYIDGFTKDSPAKTVSGTVIKDATQGTGGFHGSQTDLGNIDKSQYFFLPAVGYYYTGFTGAGTYGYYWSSTTSDGGSGNWNLNFNLGMAGLYSNNVIIACSVWAAE